MSPFVDVDLNPLRDIQFLVVVFCNIEFFNHLRPPGDPVGFPVMDKQRSGANKRYNIMIGKFSQPS